MQATLIILLINLVTLMIVTPKQKKGRITLTAKKNHHRTRHDGSCYQCHADVDDVTKGRNNHEPNR